MPKHGRRRLDMGPYSGLTSGGSGPPLLPHPAVMNSAMMNPMIMVPPMPLLPMPLYGGYHPSMPPPLSTPGHVASERSQRPQSLENAPTREELACLPFFKEEFLAAKESDPTDIIIIDFDRTLLATPSLNKDLLTKQARQVLETKLEWGNTWWQSHDVLQAAIELGKWDPTLLELARVSSSKSDVLIVITTARTTESIPMIREVLSQKGVAHIDHISCSSSPRISTGSDSKGKMLELLLESYATLERLYIIDGNRIDANRYTRTATRFVHEGWLNSEAFYVIDKVLNPTTLPLLAERQLIQKLLRQSNLPIEARVVEQSWLYKLTLESRKQLIKYLLSALPDDTEFEHIECQQVDLIVPPSSGARKAVNTEPQTHVWKPVKLEIADKQCRFYLQSPQNASTQILLSAGKLNSYSENRILPVDAGDLLVNTYTYEVRRLDVMLNASSRRNTPTIR